MPHAFKRRVVQVHVRQFDFGLRQRVGIDGKVMVMRSDLDFAGVQLLNGMIAAVVSEFEFESFAAERNAGKLMSEADAENRLASHKAADVVDRVGARLGIAGAVGEEDAIRLERENVFCWRLRGDDGYATAFAT